MYVNQPIKFRYHLIKETNIFKLNYILKTKRYCFTISSFFFEKKLFYYFLSLSVIFCSDTSNKTKITEIHELADSVLQLHTQSRTPPDSTSRMKRTGEELDSAACVSTLGNRNS